MGVILSDFSREGSRVQHRSSPARCFRAEALHHDATVTPLARPGL